MNTENTPPITRQEARTALDEIDRVRDNMRRTLAAGSMAPMLILWGVIWLAGFSAEQFMSHAYRLWIVLDVIGIAASLLLGASYPTSPVKGRSNARIGVSWVILFAYAILWTFLLIPPGMQDGGALGAYGPVLERKMALLWVTVCMFAYVVMGVWLDRFLVWLGALVTLLSLAGFFFEQPYFFLWVGVTGGGSLVLSGVFIRKFWSVAHA